MPLSEFKKLTDQHPDKEFCLSYVDGHSSFMSQNLVDRLDCDTRNSQQLENGVIISEVERDKALLALPGESSEELKKMALFAQNIFLENGVNRVRHLTARKDHWKCLKKLEQEGLLKLNIEMFFSEFMGQSLKEAIDSFNSLKEESSSRVFASGVKLFYDGSFGSDTAYTSLKDTILPRCSKEDLRKKIVKIFEKANAPVAVHTIGDRALEDVISIYSELDQSKETPALHLEHAPIFSKKTLEILRKQNLSCTFHFQPSHWTKDRKWYEKYKSKLKEHEIYPFEFLENHNYSFHFGSDAPVVDCSTEATLMGLELIESDRSRSKS